jgi:hypothetical protein
MRRMVVVASVLSIMVLVVTIGSALALDCHGGVVVSGASPWEVKERCGEPTTIDDMMKHLHQRTYDPISQASVDIVGRRCSRAFGPPILARRASSMTSYSTRPN